MGWQLLKKFCFNEYHVPTMILRDMHLPHPTLLVRHENDSHKVEIYKLYRTMLLPLGISSKHFLVLGSLILLGHWHARYILGLAKFSAWGELEPLTHST